MQFPLTKSKMAIYLLLGFTLFLVLYAAGWILTTAHTNAQLELMQRNEQAAVKMHVLASLIEIARERSRLAHEMILIEDVFARDELAQAVNSLAADFVIKRRELLALPLTEETSRILDEQSSFYPIVIQGFNQVAGLLLEDTPEARVQARNILLNEIVPNQHRIIDNFMRVMRNIEQEVTSSSKDLRQQYESHSKLRNTLGIFTIFISLIIVFVVTRNITMTERRLIKFSNVDALTELQNRRSFDHLLEHEWKRSVRGNQPLSLIMIDVDHFKAYNDTYGHHEGDSCLRLVADLMSRELYREEDTIARYGGEEFVVLLPNVDEDGALEVAERIRMRVLGERIKHEASKTDQYLTASLGVATFTASRDHLPGDLLRAADHALYQSKAAGRNQVRIYDPAISVISSRKNSAA